MSAPRPIDFSMPEGLSGANRYGKASQVPKDTAAKEKLSLNDGEVRVKVRVDGASPREFAVSQDSALGELHFLIWKMAGEAVSFKVMHNGHLISTVKSIDSADGASGSKSLQELGAKAGTTLMVLCTTTETIESIQEADRNVGKFDGRRDFAQEQELERQRREAAPRFVRKAHGSLQDYSWGFSRIEPLTHDPETGVPYTTPPPQEAEKLLQSLAQDKGIEAIMKKYNWRVGLLTELAPGINNGMIGASEQCILGLNVNMGQEIKLRLRTSDLKSFRPYLAIKETLIHELTHNVHNDHPPEFWELFRKLMKEAEVLDWTKSKGHSLSDDSVSHYHYSDHSGSHSCKDHGHTLGGNTEVEEIGLSERELALIAAEQRLLNSQTKQRSQPETELATEIRKLSGPASAIANPVTSGAEVSETTAGAQSTAEIEHSADSSSGASGDLDSPHGGANSTEQSVVPSGDSRVVEPQSTAQVDAVELLEAAPASSTTESVQTPCVAAESSKDLPTGVEQLTSMGFSVQNAVIALDRFKGSVERAADWLFREVTSDDGGTQQLAEHSALPISSNPPDHIVETEDLKQLKSRVGNAVQRFVGGIAPDWESARVGLQTLTNMLEKILGSPNEEKYRRIRLSNTAYLNKIGKHDGGKELLLAANFSFSADGEALCYSRQEPAELATARQVLTDAMDSLP